MKMNPEINLVFSIAGDPLNYISLVLSKMKQTFAFINPNVALTDCHF